MRYVVDGYNLLFALKIPGGNLHTQRHALVALIAAYNTLVKWDITLVFDSQFQKGEGTKNKHSSIDVIYTDEGQTADDFLLTWIEGKESPKEVTLVTSDKRLGCRARALLAKTEDVLPFFSSLKKKAAQKRLLIEKKEPSPKNDKAVTPPPQKSQKSIACSKKPPEELEDYYYRCFVDSYLELEGKDAPLTIEGETARWLRLFENNS